MSASQRVSRGFHRLGLLLCLNASVALAADPVALTCSGKTWSPEDKLFNTPIPEQSLIIDVDKKEVITGAIGSYVITGATDAKVFFESDLYVHGKKAAGKMKGSIDRFTGSVSISSYDDGADKPSSTYHLSCKPANAPLF